MRACVLRLRVRRPARVNELAEKCARVPRGNGRRRSSNDDSVRGRFRRRPNVAAAARSSNSAMQQKPLCVVVRSNARSIASSPLIAHFAAAGEACAYDDRGDTTINEMIKTLRRRRWWPALAKRTPPSILPRAHLHQQRRKC